MTADDTLFQALAAFRLPEAKTIEYRIYYDPCSGEVLNYTNDDLPGSYITVDRETFSRHRFDCSIKQGKLVPYRPPLTKLVPSEQGTACHPRDITLIAHSHAQSRYWQNKTYETD